MRINIIINDETIRKDIEQTVCKLEEDDEIYFDFESEKNEFIDECLDEICTKYETIYNYSPDYRNEIIDMYELNFN